MDLVPRAAYVHVPFCRHRCGYCNFTVSTAAESQAEHYLEALQRELQQHDQPYPVDTLFYGGGTPTQLTAKQLQALFRMVQCQFPTTPNAEISVEANPEDITPELCSLLRDAGVTRVSLGVQSFRTAKLRQLERHHDARVAREAVERLKSFCRNLSIDLIFAAPDETVADWRDDLQAAAACEPQHVSTYGLTLERGTTFWGRHVRGELNEVDETQQRQLYEASIDFWQGRGFEHYEVSNFALPGFRCRHNQVYWRGEEYFAVGPGAARYVGTWRETNHRSTSTYIRRLLAGRSPVADREQLRPEERLRERIVLKLRMREGISLADFAQTQGISLEACLGALYRDFQQHGLWEVVDGCLRLTREGLLVSDAIWPYVLRPTWKTSVEESNP